MRLIKKRQQYTYQESYLISISDIMMGLLFIFIIILVYFASISVQSKLKAEKAESLSVQSRLRAEKAESLSVQSRLRAEKAELLSVHSRLRAEKAELLAQNTVDQLSDTRKTRRQILWEIKKNLIHANVHILIDEKNGILRLSEGTISFKHNSAEFTDESSKQNLMMLSEALANILPCYLSGEKSENCSKTHHTIESIFVEGHTDTSGTDDINWVISIQRALAALNFILEKQPALEEMRNNNGQKLLSVAGYGKCRPLPQTHEMSRVEYNKMNRRIDLRIIMTPPENLEAIKSSEGWLIKEKQQ